MPGPEIALHHVEPHAVTKINTNINPHRLAQVYGNL